MEDNIFHLIIYTIMMIAFAVIVMIQLKQIKGDIKTIMGQQEEFNAKITAANEALDSIGAAVTAEAEQIAEFIRTHPGIDTSSLDGVVTRLQGVSENIGTIFEPAPEGKPANS